jgi:two-component system NarL family sensor kinase
MRECLLSIQLVKDDEGINLSIEDNGVGFDKNNTKNGIGLENIKSRIALINGEIEYDTTLGKGTLVNIFIPD